MLEAIVLWVALAITPVPAIGAWESEADCRAAVEIARNQGNVVSDCVRVEFKPGGMEA